MAEETYEGKVTKKKSYVPDSEKDYDLCGVDIEEAENGVVVKCRYRMKPEIEDKIRKQGGSPYQFDNYGDSRHRHVFEDKADAKKFINDELDRMWA